MRNIRHGHTIGKTSPTYNVWSGMRQRCSNPKASKYENYGGRGITVCGRWQVFENFLADMGERPKGKSLDRINNDGPYSPENCVWATAAEQNRNNRHTRNLTFQGTTMCLMDWAKQTGLSYFTLRSRLRFGWSVEAALTTPVVPLSERNQHKKKRLTPTLTAIGR